MADGHRRVVAGNEQRQGMRALARIELSWVISALSLEERGVLDECLDAASKSGLVCAPFWGRGVPIAGMIGATALLNSGAWTWSVGDYILFQPANQLLTAYENYEVRTITGKGVGSITLNAALNLQYQFPCLAWPLLFGKFSSEKMSAVTSWHGDVKVTLSQLAALDQPPIGITPPPPGVGIGQWKVGTTFQVQ